VKILFHANTLNYRGTSVAIADYAHYNQEILGNESVITYCKTYGPEKDMGNEQAVIDELEKKFKVVGYRAGDLEKKIDQEKVDLAYFIDSGERKPLPTNCKTAVHAVFQYNQPHGDKYAYISKWLSDEMSQGQTPYVPHIVNLPPPGDTDLREFFMIRPDQTVIGRMGGYYTFDIPGVKETIKKLLDTDKFVFAFLNTEPFVQHDNVMYFNETHSPVKKSNFIHMCDAMLHARGRGESFGLSIAEFLHFNKPVIAWNGGHDKNHLEMLKGSNTLYNNEDDLNYLLHNVKDIKEDWTQRVKEFNPKDVMKKFDEVFLC